MISCNVEKCDFCGTCVAVCPVDAIDLSETKLEIDYEKCTECLNCIKVCPFEAMEEQE